MSAVLDTAPLAPLAGPGFWHRALRHPSFVVGLVLTLVVGSGLLGWLASYFAVNRALADIENY